MRDVFFLSSGTFLSPAAIVRPRAGLPTLELARLVNTVAVVVRDSGDVVLVDCGLSRETCAGPVRSWGRLQAAMLNVRARRGDAIVDQLAKVGIDAGRVRTIVATHLHLDHVGGARDFPDAELVCSDVELSAWRVRPASFGYRPQDLETARLRPVYLGAGPSYGFGASFDLFGDGEVVLLDAHGHTAGQVAVALRSRERCFVHVGDAAYETWEWGLSPAGPSLIARLASWRPDLLAQTYASIRDCEADPRRPVVVPSHDGEVFGRLPQRPANAAVA